MHCSKVSHLKAAFRVLKYLKGCPNKGMCFKHDDQLSICAYYDFDWTSCCMTRKSVIDYFIFVGSNLVSYKSKK